MKRAFFFCAFARFHEAEGRLARPTTIVMILSNTGIPHHNTGGFVSHRKFLADKEYGEALDTLVKACSDMLACPSTP